MNPALTALETAALRGFLSGAYSFFDMGLAEGSDSWSDVFIDEMASAIDRPTKSARGVFSSLVKKGMFTTGDADPDRDGSAPVTLTALGVEAIESLIPAHAIDTLDHTAPLTPAEAAPVEDVTDAVTTMTAADLPAPAPSTKAATKRQTFDHAGCSHARTGREGKIARAKCRRDRAEAARLAEAGAKAAAAQEVA